MPVPPPAICQGARSRAALGLVLAALLLLLGGAPELRAQSADGALTAEQTARFAAQAEAWHRQLAEQVMPFWYDRTIDRENGGYILPDARTPDKLLVTQARLTWGFARAYRMGIRDPQRDYLAAAANGYRFLQSTFLDPLHGGYYWMASRVGRPLNLRKLLFGQACALEALVEYYRASGDPAALQAALDLYETLIEHARDPVNGGWIEHFEADWRPLADAEGGAVAPPTDDRRKQSSAQELLVNPDTVVAVGVVGTRSGEAHLQLMEALTQLLLATRAAGAPAPAAGPGIADALAATLELNLTRFFPPDPAETYPYRKPDGQRPLGAKFREISYGRNVAFAWQMVATQEALGREPLWERFDALLRHALKYGFDHERGGLYGIGFGNRPALATEKIWWAQAEMLAALTTAVSQHPDPAYVRALEQLIEFLTAYQIDPADGIWFDAVQADGSPWRKSKATHWKASYHDLRALAKFIETFGAS